MFDLVIDYAEELFKAVLARREKFPSISEAAKDLEARAMSTPPFLSSNYKRFDKCELIQLHKSRFSLNYQEE